MIKFRFIGITINAFRAAFGETIFRANDFNDKTIRRSKGGRFMVYDTHTAGIQFENRPIRVLNGGRTTTAFSVFSSPQWKIRVVYCFPRTNGLILSALRTFDVVFRRGYLIQTKNDRFNLKNKFYSFVPRSNTI